MFYQLIDASKEKWASKPFPRAKSKPQSNQQSGSLQKTGSLLQGNSEFSDGHYSLAAFSTEIGSELTRNNLGSIENSAVLAPNKRNIKITTSKKQPVSEEKKQKFELKELMEDLDEDLENFEKKFAEKNEIFTKEEWKVVGR